MSRIAIIKIYTLLALAFGGLLFYGPAIASCGTISCSLNSSWDEFDPSQHGWGLDVRLSHNRAGTLRAGSKKIVADLADEEVENLHTVNNIISTTIDYAIDERRGISLYVPYMMRDHSHSVGDGSGILTGKVETFKARALGDVKVIGRYRWTWNVIENSNIGVKLGLKLNTGRKNIQWEAGGVPSEVSLQPGNGSTDIIFAGFWQRSPSNSSWNHFAQTSLQHSINSSPVFKPGKQINLDVGSRYFFNHDLSGLLQLNAQWNSADTGLAAPLSPITGEASSGGRIYSITPGLSYALAREVQLYSLIQIPVYQHVNGEQLTSKAVFSLGMTRRF